MSKVFVVFLVVASQAAFASYDFKLDCGDHWVGANIEVNYPTSEVTTSGDGINDFTTKATTVISGETNPESGPLKEVDGYHFNFWNKKGHAVFFWNSWDNGPFILKFEGAKYKMDCNVIDAPDVPDYLK